jgi:hypothetical protein
VEQPLNSYVVENHLKNLGVLQIAKHRAMLIEKGFIRSFYDFSIINNILELQNIAAQVYLFAYVDKQA